MTGSVTPMPDDARRPYGTGSLYTRPSAHGDVWYGQWRANGRQVKRRIGLKRPEGSRDGLTRKMAQAELARLMAETVVKPRAGERLDISDVSHRYRLNAERKGRKRSTVMDIESHTRVHLEPFFGGRAMDSITPEDVNDFVSMLEGRDMAAKTIRNVIGTLSALFNYARAPRNRWASSNPCDGLDLPTDPQRDKDVRFLTLKQVDALVEHARPGAFQQLDKALFLTAAMTGLRKGELLALRWTDVDWPASRIRVRQNYVRGEFGTPKSKRSTRSVPMADEVAGMLDRLSQASAHTSDNDLVFAHPDTGGPLPKANVTRRMRAALKAAGIDDRHFVFHDLRHTFGTRMAAAGVPMRTLQEWMGHRDLATTQIYADYAPSAREAEMVAHAFERSPGNNPGTNLSRSEVISDAVDDGAEPIGPGSEA